MRLLVKKNNILTPRVHNKTNLKNHLKGLGNTRGRVQNLISKESSWQAGYCPEKT
jgi:hypothetical protein